MHGPGPPPPFAWMLRIPSCEPLCMPAGRIQLSRRLKRSPPPRFYDNSTGVVSPCGEYSKPYPLEPSPSTTNSPSASGGEGFGKTRPLAKVSASNVPDTSCSPKFIGANPVGGLGDVSPRPPLECDPMRRDTGEQYSLFPGGHRGGRHFLTEPPCAAKNKGYQPPLARGGYWEGPRPHGQ